MVELIEASRLAEAQTVLAHLSAIPGEGVDRAELWERVRNTAINAGAMALAVAPARRCAALSANQVEAHTALGNVLVSLGRCEEALAPLGRALELGETRVQGTIDYCRAQLQRSR